MRFVGLRLHVGNPQAKDEIMGLAPNQWSVAELLANCSRRPPDEIAWKEFVYRYHAIIRSSVAKTFHKKAREEADRKPQFPEDAIDDLVQTVYFRLIEDGGRAIDRFEGEHDNSIYQYLVTISVNVVRDHFREMRAQKRPKISFSLDELLENSGDSALMNQTMSDLEGNPLKKPTARISLDDIEQALEKAVTGKNRDRDLTIFKLRYYHGMTLDEITKVMGLGLSPISVGSVLNRILKKIKHLLETAGD